MLLCCSYRSNVSFASLPASAAPGRFAVFPSRVVILSAAARWFVSLQRSVRRSLCVNILRQAASERRHALPPLLNRTDLLLILQL